MDENRSNDIKALISQCKIEPNPERRMKILLVVNAKLPPTKKLHIPAFLTDDYIERALYEIEKALKSSY